MIICIIASLDFTPQILDISDKLTKYGHTAMIPPTSDMIRRGEISIDDIFREKASGDIVTRTIRQDSIRSAFDRIKDSDAVLVLNYKKNGIEYYIGGNTFLEIGFAYVLKKKIFLLNPVLKLGYEHEILEMKPVVLHGDLSNII